MSELYQVKNTGNKCWVKMRAGKVLGNRPFSEGKYPDIPVKKKPKEDDKKDSGKDSDSGGLGFFDFD